MSRYRVEFGRFALRHLDELWDYVAEKNSGQVADRLILRIVTYCNELAEFPSRGQTLPMLAAAHRLNRTFEARDIHAVSARIAVLWR